ncbi:MAG TPA: dienelactone hydrolase family protein [Gaiellaceae bacterium]|nr:dienelactone hydrolase family protein [Gaiellaceae bacterium]
MRDGPGGSTMVVTREELVQGTGIVGRSRVERRDVVVDAGGVRLPGVVAIPEQARGVVVFAHGSGSSRLSRRNEFVAGELNAAGLATLLFDLLIGEEERDRSNVFDVGLLAGRLGAATGWVEEQPGLRRLPIGYFGASTGAAAALWAAADRAAVGAVVSRGGRPDLAAARLPEVRAPTLLVVGELDTVVLELNRAALGLLVCPAELRVVDGATHLFEEPGTLAQAALHARDWFVRHLQGS